MYSNRRIALCGLLLSIVFVTNPVQAQTDRPVLALTEAQHIALQKEPGVQARLLRAKAFLDQSIADSQLPDPQLIVGVQNLPVDSFDLDQEAMTQLKLGIRQQLPRGDSLSIKGDIAKSRSDEWRQESEIRRRRVKLEVGILWLDSAYWQEYINTLDQDRYLFEQLVEVTESLYSLGRKDQEDVLRAQLELSKLQQRWLTAVEQLNVHRDNLSQWVGSTNAQRPFATLASMSGTRGEQNLPVNTSFKDASSLEPNNSFELIDDVELLDSLRKHPEFLKLSAELQRLRSRIRLAEEAYKPQFGVELGLGYRADAEMSRSDLMSAMVTLDMPLFTKNRQDRRLSAEQNRALAVEEERQALMRKLHATTLSLDSRRSILEQRITQYRTELIPHAEQQAEAALSAYQSDVGDFADVMQGYITVLNTKLDFLRVSVDKKRVREKLNYYKPIDSV